MKHKKLLMLGGGFLQCFVIKKAKQLGYEVHVLDANPHAEGFKYADACAVINIVDEKACLSYAHKNNINGVLTAATDYGVLSMSRIASELNLPGINYQSAQLIKNKAKVRKCLFDAKADDTGYSFEISSIETAQEVLSRIKFPIMVKPCDGSGSRGATRVDCSDFFLAACEYAMNESITHRAVAEPFVIGHEYGVESFVNQGEIHILAVMQKDMTQPPYYAELGHAIPSGLSHTMEQKVKECVKRALIALNVNHGSVNMDLLIDDDGGVHIVDIGARMGGNLIGSHIIPIGTGVDYMANMIKAAMGDRVDFTPQNTPKNVATKLLALTPGVVKSLPNLYNIAAAYDVVIEHHMKVGDTITPYRTNLDGCGYVVAQGCDIYEVIDKAQLVREIIDCTIVR